jgi:hypothetical protein
MKMILRRFEDPDELREFTLGVFEIIAVDGTTIGRARYEPGWKWSTHVGGDSDARCDVEHIGVVLGGRAAVLMNDGTYYEMTPGDIFSIPPGHDSWVVGDEPYVSLHLVGADHYAVKE